ncbi:hypothetical protein CIPOMA221M_12895 [Citrobacter portucalensis]|uniref:hypothetical protein n=1 Tax=Citrobacter portucalensis TaxID=1639133 RepID=UPI003B242537
MTYPIDRKIIAKEAAKLFGFKSSTFYGYKRHHNDFPIAKYLAEGRHHYYDVLSLAQWFSRYTERRPHIDANLAACYPVAREVMAIFSSGESVLSPCNLSETPNTEDTFSHPLTLKFYNQESAE